MLILTLLLAHAAYARSINGVNELTPEQMERIKNWKKTDEQNIWELSGQFEGDIILDEDQRNGIIGNNYRWPNRVIPYMFDVQITEEEKEQVNLALKDYTSLTCITPKLITAPVADYVLIKNDKPGCNSRIGRRGGQQILNLETDTSCFDKGVVLHEFLHALGFYHQQSATDRDDYVTIVEENIQKEYLRNFNKLNSTVITSFGIEYDYGSVLHYSAYAFSIGPGLKTIITKDPNAEIGQRDGLSPKDIEKLQKMYGCA